ncbi:RRQRL motif-containing zinc-binding protein [Amycolatopsis sp. H20-H5]|uniref:RRQRL motif-containing zinc-binding protein n=1 Tax=Amycolatopsis sp. H20-H5 TaxID=3046309 RepID=UPI002DB87581|nr:RRQRL motif-containing zinc-binding protein [Amycolatopsis sp. H20-H5]MEC3974590.1 RRQRL motif-containing zinc-binding protein [Amycolatopsis sp. H20-H5]
MNPRKVKLQTTTLFDGHTHHIVECRGFRDGLAVFGWNEAPEMLLTTKQLHAEGLCRNRQDPAALLVFRHHRPYSRETVSELFWRDLAAPSVPRSPLQVLSLVSARRALRVCVTCTEEQTYRVPTSTHQCWACFDLDLEAAA